MTTAELSAETGVSPATIRKLAKDLGGSRDGRRRSYVFPKKAVKQLRQFLKEAVGREKKSGQGNTRREKGAPGWRTVRIRFQKKEAGNTLRIHFGRKDAE